MSKDKSQPVTVEVIQGNTVSASLFGLPPETIVLRGDIDPLLGTTVHDRSGSAPPTEAATAEIQRHWDISFASINVPGGSNSGDSNEGADTLGSIGKDAVELADSNDYDHGGIFGDSPLPSGYEDESEDVSLYSMSEDGDTLFGSGGNNTVFYDADDAAADNFDDDLQREINTTLNMESPYTWLVLAAEEHQTPHRLIGFMYPEQMQVRRATLEQVPVIRGYNILYRHGSQLVGSLRTGALEFYLSHPGEVRRDWKGTSAQPKFIWFFGTIYSMQNGRLYVMGFCWDWWHERALHVYRPLSEHFDEHDFVAYW